MGRGRAKAKQTKVARELKYGTVNTDLSALQAELASGHHHVLPTSPVEEVAEDDVDDDPYAKYYDDDEPDPA
ncbi:MAG: DUF3073 domain-containing protein [Actinomycetes bacterium]|jgi:hypothetical protein